MKLWSMVSPAAPDAFRRTIEEAEASGLEGIWVPQTFGPPFPSMGAAATMSKRLKIGSSVALAFTRSPLETALSMLDLDLLSGGRAILGLGTSIRHLNENAHGVVYGKPLAHLREVVRIVRDVIERGNTGDLGLYEGEHKRVDFRGFRTGAPLPAHGFIPIYLSALFRKSVELAAEIGDGLLGHPVWSAAWVKDTVLPTITATLAKVKRPRAALHVNLAAYVAIDPDRRRAIDDARNTIAFYASIAQYEKYFVAHGFGDAARAAAAAAGKGDFVAMARAVPDEMVSALAIAGTADEARSRVDELARLGDSLTLIPPGTAGTLPPERMAAYAGAIAATFYGGKR